MTITRTELDLTILDEMEFESACEFSEHNSSHPAEWVFLALRPLECGCTMPDRMFCTPCKVKRSTYEYVECTKCYTFLLNDLSAFRFVSLKGMA